MGQKQGPVVPVRLQVLHCVVCCRACWALAAAQYYAPLSVLAGVVGLP